MDICTRLGFYHAVMLDIADQPVDPCRLAKKNVSEVAEILLEAAAAIRDLTDKNEQAVSERDAIAMAAKLHSALKGGKP